MADYSSLDNLEKLSQIVIAILTVGVVIYAQRQVSEAVRSRNQQKTISKHEIILALDARLNSKDLLHLFSYFLQIIDFVKGKLKAKDHTPAALRFDPIEQDFPRGQAAGGQASGL